MEAIAGFLGYVFKIQVRVIQVRREPTLLDFDMIGFWECKINLMNYE